MGVALAVEDLFHVDHGLVVLPGASQLDGGGTLRIEVFRRALGPDQRGIQGFLVGPKVFGDAEGAFGDAGVLGRASLLYIVGECDVEAVTLPGEFGHQQGIEGLFAERAVLLGLFGDCGIALGRRLAFGGLVGQGLAAAEQQQGGQQC
ncbi:hypothetical protein D3C81_1013540 [compost metagenome]